MPDSGEVFDRTGWGSAGDYAQGISTHPDTDPGPEPGSGRHRVADDAAVCAGAETLRGPGLGYTAGAANHSGEFRPDFDLRMRGDQRGAGGARGDRADERVVSGSEVL